MPNKFSEVFMSDIPVLCIEVKGVVNSGKAFEHLENKLGSLQGRKFYGALLGGPEDGIYRACVALKEDEYLAELGLLQWKIPGGKYLRCKIQNWTDKLDQISKVFSEMAILRKSDDRRPHIEFYRSQKELILMMPVGE